MRLAWRLAACLSPCGWSVALLALASSSGAITLGQVDDFEDGTTQGWGSGPLNPTPPSNVPNGGPQGAGDAYLQVTSSGAGGAGSRPTFFNTSQWTGDYTSAGVVRVTARLNNLGANPLEMRLQLTGGGGVGAFTTSSVQLPVASGWLHVVFPVGPGDLTGTGDVAATLANVVEARFCHNPAPNCGVGPPQIAATLGVDNLRAAGAAIPAASGGVRLALAALLALVALSLAPRAWQDGRPGRGS